jgi:hypothetical protein
LDAFRDENPSLVDLIRYWWGDYKNFIEKSNKLYQMKHFKGSYQILATIICRVYGEEGCTHFKLDCVPPTHYVVEAGQVFNWAQILSVNIFKVVKEDIINEKPCFYMSAYLFDAICPSMPFPLMGWSWNPDIPPVHVYCS